MKQILTFFPKLPLLFLTTVALAAAPEPTSVQKSEPAKKAARVPEGVKVLRDVEYVPGGHERQRLDLFLPENGTNLPLIVWVHGGGWEKGSKENCPAIGATRSGYAVASINYRLSQHAPFPAQIEDCKSAIRWLRANAVKYNFNPDRIGVWGASAGGHLVALLGTAGDVKDFDRGENLKFSSRVQAVCDWFGPANMVPWIGEDGAAANTVVKLFGGKATREKAAQASPVTYVTKDDAPFLIMHGDKDPLVPFRQSEELAAALKQAGVEVVLVKLEGAGHGGANFTTPENLGLILKFFDRHLKL